MVRAIIGSLAMILMLGAHSASAASAAAATTAPTTSPAPEKPETALQAISLEQVRARYETALNAARAQYLRDLNELKRRAMKAEDLEDANTIEQQIRQVQRGRPPGASLRPRVDVQANQDWQPSTIAVKKGDVLEVTARGQWVVNDRSPAETTYGPDGLRADGTADFHGQWATLLARIGPRVYLVGKGIQIIAEQDGVLEFRSNDFSLGDNQGSITATIVKNGE